MENLHLKNLKNNGKITIKKSQGTLTNNIYKYIQTKKDIKKQGISLVMFTHHHNQQKYKNGLITKP